MNTTTRKINVWAITGLGVGLVIAVAGTILAFNVTNPFLKVGNINMGFQTKAQLQDTLTTHLENTPITVEVNGEKVTSTLKEAGVEIANMDQTVNDLFNQEKLWKVGEWSNEQPQELPLTVNDDTLDNFIETIGLTPTIPAYVENVDNSYIVTPVEPGKTLDAEQLITYAQQQLKTPTDEPLGLIDDAPEVTNEQAQEFADKLNNLTQGFVYQAGEEQVKPVVSEPLFTISPQGEPLKYEVNAEAVKTVAAQAPTLINRQGVANHNIVDSQNNVLHTTFQGTTGRELNDDVSIVEKKTMTALTEGNPVVELDVSETKPEDVNTSRRIVVDISDQKVTLYENEQVYKTYVVSTGKNSTPTYEGDFKVRAFVRIQDMGGPGYDYLQPDVPWVVYFNGDIAFHGAYWHNEFGRQRSHGCVNLTVAESKELYDFAYTGMEVKVQP